MDRSPGSLRTYLVLTDSSGVVVDRAGWRPPLRELVDGSVVVVGGDLHR